MQHSLRSMEELMARMDNNTKQMPTKCQPSSWTAIICNTVFAVWRSLWRVWTTIPSKCQPNANQAAGQQLYATQSSQYGGAYGAYGQQYQANANQMPTKQLDSNYMQHSLRSMEELMARMDNNTKQ